MFYRCFVLLSFRPRARPNDNDKNENWNKFSKRVFSPSLYVYDKMYFFVAYIFPEQNAFFLVSFICRHRNWVLMTSELRYHILASSRYFFHPYFNKEQYIFYCNYPFIVQKIKIPHWDFVNGCGCKCRWKS